MGSHSKSKLVNLCLGALNVAIPELVSGKVKLSMAPLLVVQLRGVELNENDQNILCYIAGAILHRTRKHFRSLPIAKGSPRAAALEYLDHNTISATEAVADQLPASLTIAREKVNLAFVSANFMTFFALLEAAIGLREFCIRRGKALRVAGKRGMCKQQSLRCILKAAPPVRLSTELARLAGEDTSSVDANVADCLRPLFVKLICK